ncbi:MAG: amidohydrolase family protein [Candidatus Hodarchaeota archaeon]
MENVKSFIAHHVLLKEKHVRERYINTKDGWIESITEKPVFPNNIVDLGENRMIFPGCVNTHSHAFQSLLRGFTNDCTLEKFLEIVYSAAESYTRKDIYKGARLAFKEMLLNGITTVCEFHYLNGLGNENAEQVIKAALDLGIRMNFSRCIIDNPKLSDIVKEDLNVALKRHDNLRMKYMDNPLVNVSIAAHSVYYSSDEVIMKVKETAEKHRTRWFMHFSDSQGTRDYATKRFGISEAKYLEKKGMLDKNLVAIHAIWANDEDIRILGKNGVSVSHNPMSNQFLGERVALVPEMIKNGVLVGLGTDGAASNPSLSIFQEMKHMLLLQKSRLSDPAGMVAEQGFKIATENGGLISGFKTGKLAAGYLADFIACDINHPTLQPLEKAFSHFVYSISSKAIMEVYVNGVQVI